MMYGSHGWYQYDACPKCGFAYGSNCQNIEHKDPKEVWKVILDADKIILKHLGFPVTIKGIYQWMKSLPRPDPNERESVFIYDDRKFFKEKEFVFR